MNWETKLRAWARLRAAVGWLGFSATAAGEIVIQRWGVGERVSHPGSIMIVDAAGGKAVIQVDLAELAKGRAKVHSAALLAGRGQVDGTDDEAMVKAEVHPLAAPFRPPSKPSVAPAWQELYRALHDTKRAFAARWGNCWAGSPPAAAAGSRPGPARPSSGPTRR